MELAGLLDLNRFAVVSLNTNVSCKWIEIKDLYTSYKDLIRALCSGDGDNETMAKWELTLESFLIKTEYKLSKR